jgi:3-hydroxyacyl-[acyl-carrier-protein] dehydratase
MLQNDFFSFAAPQVDGNTVKATLTLNAAHKIFAGHFPQHPIVPGVCMMQMVKEVVENVIGKETNLSIAHNIKFLTIIDPRENKTIQLDYKFTIPEEGKIMIDAQLLNNPTVFFKFKGTFVEI